MLGQATFGHEEHAVWVPGPEHIARSKLARAMQAWGFDSLSAFHKASVEQPDWFWPAAADDLGFKLTGERLSVCDESAGRTMPAWFTGQRFNAVWSALEQHVHDSITADKIAVIYEGDSGQSRSMTYRQLHAEVERFAAAITRLGIGIGDRVALFMSPIPEASVVILGCAKVGAVIVPAFSGYGSEALASRLNASEASLLVTVDSTTRRGKRIAMQEIACAALDQSPSVHSMLVVNANGDGAPLVDGRDHDWQQALSHAENQLQPTADLDPNHPLFIIYTSGTTGAPKGIVHSHFGYQLKAAIDFGYAFDIQNTDVVTWITDMGWNLGPLMVIGGYHFGATMVFVEGVPDYPEKDRLWKIVERRGSTFLGIAPTAARGQRVTLQDLAPTTNISTLRAFASTGEAWDEPTWWWLFDTVGNKQLPIINYTGGTEVGGGIMSCYTIAPQSPASFSGPLPGMDVDVYDAGGKRTKDIGELVILNTWPGMAHGFWQDIPRYLNTYWDRWPDVWVHGDLASVDQYGFWHIRGRSDDTLKIGGRRVGPAEIESALTAINGVAEAAVIGAPDEMSGMRIVAFVVARPGISLNETDLIQAMISKVGKGLTPSKIHLIEALPKTKNGKIMRRAIRARYLGQPAGDMSALDPMTPLECVPKLNDLPDKK